MVPVMNDDANFLNRAFRAYLATDGAARQPIERHSTELKLNGLRYVVLGDDAQVVAVYRVKNNGALRRMKRWPMSVGSAATQPTPGPEPRQPARAGVARV